MSLLNAGHVSDWNTLRLCWGLSADTQKNERAVKQGTSKKWQEESREESVSIFLNTSICLLPEKRHLLCQRIKTSHVVVRRVSQCLTFLLDSDHRKPNDWRKCLTNHRVSWELVYQNEVLKTMLTNSTTPSLPHPMQFSHSYSRPTFPTKFEPETGYNTLYMLNWVIQV